MPAPTSRGLAFRLLSNQTTFGEASIPQIETEHAIADAAYGGIPAIAMAGFGLGAEPNAVLADTAEAFLRAIRRVQGRPSGGRDQIADDDMAILGIADGLARIAAISVKGIDKEIRWIAGIADGPTTGPLWSRRARALAADLLDHRGRLRADFELANPDALALDLCLRRIWPTAFKGVGYPPRDAQQELMGDLLSRRAPVVGELERAAVWVGALRVLTGEVSATLVPDVHAVACILAATQGGLKRWVWEDRAGRAQIDPARWLIDDEAHVQAFLWSVLYPTFGAHLRDEQYLPGFGLKQPRYDFGIINLKLIVEVKLVRTRADFKKVEEEIAGDTGLYFSDPTKYDRMIAYVYDDCDNHHPELYDSLRHALRQRDARIVDVIIVRRPGMIPGRANRKSK